MKAFTPIDAATATRAVTATTARVAFSKPPLGEFQARLHNAGGATVFFRVGDSTVEAATTDIPIPAGAVEIITVKNLDADPDTHIAAITASGTATLYITTGEGI